MKTTKSFINSLRYFSCYWEINYGILYVKVSCVNLIINVNISTVLEKDMIESIYIKLIDILEKYFFLNDVIQF